MVITRPNKTIWTPVYLSAEADSIEVCHCPPSPVPQTTDVVHTHRNVTVHSPLVVVAAIVVPPHLPPAG
jgi:hypothetical protein